MKVHSKYVAIKYKVKCEDDDKDNELLARAPGGRIAAVDKGKGWKWLTVENMQEISDLTAVGEYLEGIQAAIDNGDFTDVYNAVANPPYCGEAESVFVDCKLYHIGGTHLLPRESTLISCGYKFKDGILLKEEYRARKTDSPIRTIN